jgi:hypothetical protein
MALVYKIIERLQRDDLQASIMQASIRSLAKGGDRHNEATAIASGCSDCHASQGK